MASASELLDQWVATFVEERWDDARDMTAEDAVSEEIGTGRTTDREQGIENAKAWHLAFPDVRGQIVNRVVSGNQAAGEIIWEGTNRGELNGMPPTGRQVKMRASVFLEERGGKVARLRHYIDAAGLMAQLGAMPGATQAQSASST